MNSVKLMLKFFKHKSQFSGFYMAQKHGIYLDLGLEVEIVRGGNFDKIINSLLKGTVDFAITSAPRIAISAWQGLPIKAFFVVYQRSPFSFFFHKKIKEIKKGKIGFLKDFSDAILVDIFLKKQQQLDLEPNPIIAETEIEYLSYFKNGLLAGCTGYSINEGLILEVLKVPFDSLCLAEHGLDYYGDVIIGRKDFLEKHSNLVQNFVLASSLGWQEALRHPELAAEAVLAFQLEEDNDSNLFKSESELFEFNKKGIELSKKFIDIYRSGTIDLDKCQMMMEDLLSLGIINKPYNVSHLFTNKFIK